MPNNAIPVSDIRKWCRFNASSKQDINKLKAKLARPAKPGAQQGFKGWLGTPERGRSSSGSAIDAAKNGALISRLRRRISEGGQVNHGDQPIVFRPSALEGLPTVGIPHEVPVERRFETGGRSFELRGRLDAIAPDGSGWEYKTNETWKSKSHRIHRSCQWRCYLWMMPELVAVHYCLFRIKHEADQTVVTERWDGPVMARYEGLDQEVLEMLEGFVDWVDRHYPAYWN